MGMKSDVIIRMIKSDYPIFRNISETSLKESIQVFRLFELREMESLTLTGSEVKDYLFLIRGRLEVIDESGNRLTVDPKDTQKRPVIIPPLPQKLTINAIRDSYFCHLDTGMFDYLLIMEDTVNFLRETGEAPEEYLRIARNSKVFQRVPVESAERAFRQLKEVRVNKGDDIAVMGQELDSFYIIVTGRAELTEISMETGLPEVSGELTTGDEFGEESLLRKQASESSVRMLEDGILLALGSDDFQDILAKPLITEVEPAVAKAMIDTEYLALDVRLEEEWEMEHIPETRLIPLHELRSRVGELDKNSKYLVYCRSGKRSAAATFLLTERSYTAINMKGGIISWPFEVVSED